jgi:hypothetical protein
LPLTFTYNADLVCTQDSASNWCFVDSQEWQGSDYIRYDPVMCFANGDDNSTVAPECDDPDFDVDIITDEMAALTNIYDGELVREPLLITNLNGERTNTLTPSTAVNAS